MIFRAEDRKKYGNVATFQPAINELKDLDVNGIDIFSERFYFEVLLITGDNKVLNSTFGSTEKFTCGPCCRTCRIDNNLMKSASAEIEQLLYTRENYNEDLILCDPQKTGIREPCCFYELPNFHISQNIVHDALHDVTEGLCVYSMQAIFAQLLKT